MLSWLRAFLRPKPAVVPDPKVQALADFRGITYEEAEKQMRVDEVERIILDAGPDLAANQSPMFGVSDMPPYTRARE